MEKIKYKRGVIVERDETENGIIEIDMSRMGKVESRNGRFTFEGDEMEIEHRTVGSFKEKAIYLAPLFDWILCKDGEGRICLVPVKKEKK